MSGTPSAAGGRRRASREAAPDALFEPLAMGDVTLRNRVLMAPLTRMRATPPQDLPNSLMVEYYRQRAGAGLIVSEATQVSPIGKGYMDTPGIYSVEQVAAWHRITDAVHAEGGLIAAQLWHVGRVSHESFHGGKAPVSASAHPFASRTTVRGENGRPSRVACPRPRALSTDEIAATIDDFRRATRNARDAGFDLVEIHGAHGYLIHQFLSRQSNHREDCYGGSEINRARFALEVLDAVIDAWEPQRVGMRLSPLGSFNGLKGDDLSIALLLGRELSRRGACFLHLSEPDWIGGAPIDASFRHDLRRAFDGVIIGAGSYTIEKAERLLADQVIDAAAFGRPFIANPDLVERLRNGSPLNAADPATFYGGGADGYTSYPTLGHRPMRTSHRSEGPAGSEHGSIATDVPN